MTYPDSDQTLSANNALAAAASNSTYRGADSSSDPLYLRTVASPAAASSGRTFDRSVGINRSHRNNGTCRMSSFYSSPTSIRPAKAERPGSSGATFPKINILGIDFDNVSKQDLLSELKKGVIFTPNVDHLMKLRRDRTFASVYQQADYKICDSQILIYAARFLGKPLKAKLSGSDLFHWFCDYHRYNDDIKIFLLGGADGVAKKAQERINARIGREIVVGEYSPSFGFERKPEECQYILEMLVRSPANVVAVCLGAPKQEKWIAAHRDSLPNVDIFMAIGATVDFEAGVKPRAPKYASDIGLEWLYRLICEPRRLWRRYLLDGLPFIGLVLAEKLRQLR